jgi:c-di-GMP-related signal transduction protein
VEAYLGRQPILDSEWNVAGYELLFRSSQADSGDAADGASATSHEIVNTVLRFGLDRLLGGKPVFINFDRELLLEDWTALLPPDKVVIEILGTVPPDQEILSALDKLRQQGYALALHDCTDEGRTEAFAPFVDILKVNFEQTSPADQERLVHRYRKLNIGMVAEKVETESEFRRASHLGYDYFQGLFFASPTVLQTARVPASQMSGLRLVKLMHGEELDLRAIEDLIRHDISFSHSLLTYLNSAAFHWADRIESIHQALLLLGSDEVRKWIWMASLSSLGQNRPPVLMAQVLMRGRFCEVIADCAKLQLGDSDPFLVGMFSLLEAILQMPLRMILAELNIGRNIRKALLGTGGDTDPLSLALRIVKSYELGDFHDVEVAARVIGLSADALSNCYFQSLSWVETVFSPDEQTWRASHLSALTSFHRKVEVLVK